MVALSVSSLSFGTTSALSHLSTGLCHNAICMLLAQASCTLSLSLSHSWTGILNAYWQTNLQLVIIAGCFCWSPYSLVVCRTWQQHQQQQRRMGSGGAQVSYLQEATAIHGDLKTPPTKLWACKVQWPSSSWVEDCHLCSRKEGRNWATKQASKSLQTNKPIGIFSR